MLNYRIIHVWKVKKDELKHSYC